MNTGPTGFSQHALEDYTRLEAKFRTLQHEAYAYKRQRDKLAEELRVVLAHFIPESEGQFRARDAARAALKEIYEH